MTTPRSIVVVGPTASGKTALSVELARLAGPAEVLSVDSMQVYRGMDIGTGKATAAERAAVPHHLLDLVDPDVECSVAWFQREAATAATGVDARGARVMYVGGTGLYHRAVVDNLTIPPEFPDIREELEAGIDGADDRAAATAALHARLAGVDPDAAARIGPANVRRIVRALEVVLGSGRRFSEFGPGLEEYPPSPHLIVGLAVDRDRLGPRIERRVRQMMTDGFLGEVEHLLSRPGGLSRTASQALGYRELAQHLRGVASLDEAVAETVVRTRRFAVRQERWFRRDPRVEWFAAPATAAETRSLARTIVGRLETS